MFRLSKWLRRSYRCAIEANIRRTRWSDLSGDGVRCRRTPRRPGVVRKVFEGGGFRHQKGRPFRSVSWSVSRRSLFWDLGLPSDKPHAQWKQDMPPMLLSPWPPISDKKWRPDESVDR